VYIAIQLKGETMKNNETINFVKQVLENMPKSWLTLTTHRLDIYNEKLAKVEFLEKLEILSKTNNCNAQTLSELPTAFDYIRLGHPLSCLLEWTIAKLSNLPSNNVISFSSKTISILAVLRKNLLENKKTQIIHTKELPDHFDLEILKTVYGYKFELKKVLSLDELSPFDGSTILVSDKEDFSNTELYSNIDFFLNIHSQMGSTFLVNGEQSENYIPEIQHVRRRETIAMTPNDCLSALESLTKNSPIKKNQNTIIDNHSQVLSSIQEITGTDTRPLLASSGLSIQYAIMMGLIHDALENHPGKEVKIIVPPNCYGGTNDQARRVAACLPNVEVVDLAVDGGNDMVQSVDTILEQIAKINAVPFIIAEIPTNPRVEVPELIKLKEALSKVRKTTDGEIAIDPVFILDQTFCPNVHFLGEGEILSSVRTISYVSGSKFPSGGLCTAGYCVANKKAENLISKIDQHLKLCGNEATDFQIETLAKQMPSMNKRINDAYKNTREFVNYIQKTLPAAKINFVSEELAKEDFTPSVFSLDLPTKGSSHAEKEAYKRELNYKLINLMIEKIPNESKFCVSYGQLNGCYWTIPATSTQGTTKEGDKDYIVRVSTSPNMDIELHKKVFLEFVEGI
jgi:cystathionine beta-lyase/cystathionine gamma-synthase